MDIFVVIMYFLSMLVAGPQVSLNNRDTEIKNNASRMLAAVHESMANHNGLLPTAAEFNQLMVQYSIKDPVTEQPYTSSVYFPGQDCAGSRKNRAVSIKIELTDSSKYCID